MLNATVHDSFWVPEYVIGDGIVRGIFRTYFLVMILFICFIGNLSIKHWVKFKLLRGRPVFLTQTTGWVHGPSLAKLAFDIRKLPGGWLGWMMILVTGLDLAGDYGVNLTVKSATLATTRNYYSGGYVLGNTTTSQPSLENEAFRWATGAQQNSFRNANATNLAGKHYGIYPLITNDTNFMAQTEDIIGYWSCSRNLTKPLIYDQKWKDPNTDQIYDMDIWNDLVNKGLMYGGFDNTMNNVSFYDPVTNLPYGPSTHLTIFSASSLQVGTLFNISAAVDILDMDNLGSKQMMIFGCQLRAKDAAKTVESIAKSIDIFTVLTLWKFAMAGAMYPGLHTPYAHDLEDIEVTLQLYLNAMTMVSGSQETVTDSKAEPIQLGAVTRATRIPYWIVALCIVVWLVASFVTTLLIYLVIATRGLAMLHDKKNTEGTIVSGQEIRNNTPIGMLDWMTHAAYESRDAQTIPERKHLKHWILSTTWHAGRRLAIVRSSEQGQVNPLKTPGSHATPQYFEGTQQAGYFPMTKQGYSSLTSREVS